MEIASYIKTVILFVAHEFLIHYIPPQVEKLIDKTENQSLIILKHVLNYIKKQEKYRLIKKIKKARSKRALMRRKSNCC
ncbi:MAG: hypothetical protein OXN20_10730, partial [Gemmatimonadota bacterium]|nr:hypothetical protein [Gemmatimonadota bacterium]